MLCGVGTLLLVGLCVDMISNDYTQPATQSYWVYPTQCGQSFPSIAISPMDSRLTAVLASPQTLQAMQQQWFLRIDLEHSQLPRDMARSVATAVTKILDHLTGSSSHNLEMANSQLLAALWEVMVAVLPAVAMGSPRVGLLDQRINVCLACKGTAKMFSGVPAPFDIPTATNGGSNFPYPCQHLQLSISFFIVANSMSKYLAVILMCFLLMT